MAKVNDVIHCIEEFAPVLYQENYDNSGLQVGNPDQVVTSVLLTIDVTEAVVEEAVTLGANLIISHHPVIFGGIKRLSGRNYAERILIKAIKHDISIYSCHTNIDNVYQGVSFRMAEKLGLSDVSVLKPITDNLYKLVTFVPTSYIGKVQEAIFATGAGNIGNYDSCGFSVQGNGTFRALDGANPFVGTVGQIHTEPEIRLEAVFPKHLEKSVISALIKTHPYEEVAYDIFSLANTGKNYGAGVYGNLPDEMNETDFLKKIKEIFHVEKIRHTHFLHKTVKKVALCGGSGSFLLPEAKGVGADIFISGDFKYHQFFDAGAAIVIADIGHFESEQFTVEIFYELLTKKLSNFAIYFTKVKTNPINYI